MIVRARKGRKHLEYGQQQLATKRYEAIAHEALHAVAGQFESDLRSRFFTIEQHTEQLVSEQWATLINQVVSDA